MPLLLPPRTLSRRLPAVLLVAGIAWSATPVSAQAPSTDILVLTFDEQGAPQPEPERVTDRDGYDNQPSFLPDGRLLFTAASEDGTTDIRIQAEAGGGHELLFDLAESLYSPTAIPGQDAISVVRDYGDQVQQLWRLPLDGSEPTVLLDAINPIGYHAWVTPHRLLLFVLGDPPTLQLAEVGAQEGVVLGERPGRALARLPEGGLRAGSMSWARMPDDPEAAPVLLVLEPGSMRSRRHADLPPGTQDYAWAPDGTLWSSTGTRLLRRDGDEWAEVIDLASVGASGVSRLAWSPDGRRLAIVVAR